MELIKDESSKRFTEDKEILFALIANCNCVNAFYGRLL